MLAIPLEPPLIIICSCKEEKQIRIKHQSVITSCSQREAGTEVEDRIELKNTVTKDKASSHYFLDWLEESVYIFPYFHFFYDIGGA